MGALISKVFLTLWVRPPVLHGDEVQKLLHERLPVDLKLGEIS
jgi:hypothetical protein